MLVNVNITWSTGHKHYSVYVIRLGTIDAMKAADWWKESMEDIAAAAGTSRSTVLSVTMLVFVYFL